jgi:hypothetical protein
LEDFGESKIRIGNFQILGRALRERFRDDPRTDYDRASLTRSQKRLITRVREESNFTWTGLCDGRDLADYDSTVANDSSPNLAG